MRGPDAELVQDLIEKEKCAEPGFENRIDEPTETPPPYQLYALVHRRPAGSETVVMHPLMRGLAGG